MTMTVLIVIGCVVAAPILAGAALVVAMWVSDWRRAQRRREFDAAIADVMAIAHDVPLDEDERAAWELLEAQLAGEGP